MLGIIRNNRLLKNTIRISRDTSLIVSTGHGPERNIMNRNAVEQLRSFFPILRTSVHGRPLIYLDNAATMQMPRPVMERMNAFYSGENANIHRGLHSLSEAATAAYEKVRETVGVFLGIKDTEQIVFTAGSTDGINLAACMLEQILEPGCEIVTTEMEHHSDFLPWVELAERKGLKLRIVPVKPDGHLDVEWLYSSISDKTRVIAFSELSNVTGIRNSAADIIRTVRGLSDRVYILTDGAQSAVHMSNEVDLLQTDFYCMSGHKLGAPTGTGVLYMSSRVQEELRPVRFGGGTVSMVSKQNRAYYKAPACFEPGTPNYAGVIGLGSAMDFWMRQGEKCGGRDILYDHEKSLLAELEQRLGRIPGMRILGDSAEGERCGCLSFTVEGIHAYDISRFLDQYGIAARSGHHCAMPYLTAMGCEFAVRFSVAPYNTSDEIMYTADTCEKICELIRNAVESGRKRRSTVRHAELCTPARSTGSDPS